MKTRKTRDRAKNKKGATHKTNPAGTKIARLASKNWEIRKA